MISPIDFRKLMRDLLRPIGRVVVHDDDLVVQRVPLKGRADQVDDHGQIPSLIVCGQNDAESRRIQPLISMNAPSLGRAAELTYTWRKREVRTTCRRYDRLRLDVAVGCPWADAPLISTVTLYYRAQRAVDTSTDNSKAAYVSDLPSLLVPQYEG